MQSWLKIKRLTTDCEIANHDAEMISTSPPMSRNSTCHSLSRSVGLESHNSYTFLSCSINWQWRCQINLACRQRQFYEEFRRYPVAQNCKRLLCSLFNEHLGSSRSGCISLAAGEEQNRRVERRASLLQVSDRALQARHGPVLKLPQVSQKSHLPRAGFNIYGYMGVTKKFQAVLLGQFEENPFFVFFFVKKTFFLVKKTFFWGRYGFLSCLFGGFGG